MGAVSALVFRTESFCCARIFYFSEYKLIAKVKLKLTILLLTSKMQTADAPPSGPRGHQDAKILPNCEGLKNVGECGIRIGAISCPGCHQQFSAWLSLNLVKEVHEVQLESSHAGSRNISPVSVDDNQAGPSAGAQNPASPKSNQPMITSEQVILTITAVSTITFSSYENEWLFSD